MSDAFAVFVRCDGVQLDRCDIALPLQITHGRSSVDYQPDAPVCTFTYLGATTPIALGSDIEIEVAGTPGSTWIDATVLWTDAQVSWLGTRGLTRRFRGYVTAVSAVEAFGKVAAWEITATGSQAKLGRTRVDISRPEETDVARVQAICAAAGTPVTVLGQAGVTLVADAIERDALDALHEVCVSSGGLLWQNRDGDLIYGTIYRHDHVPQWRFLCELILDGIAWNRGIENVINHVTMVYGDPDNPTQQTFRDDPSILQWGYEHVEVATLCATPADAALLGTVILARRKQPRWVMPGVVALHKNATPAQWAQIANADVGHTALIDVEEAPGPVPGVVTSWQIEGWVETWEANGRRVQFALSEYRLGVPIDWDAADDETWAHWATGSWLDAMVEV